MCPVYPVASLCGSTHKHTYTQTHTHTERGRETNTERGRERQTQREKRRKERERDTETQREEEEGTERRNIKTILIKQMFSANPAFEMALKSRRSFEKSSRFGTVDQRYTSRSKK